MIRIIILALALFLPAQAEASRPAGCPSRWCGCWLGIYVGIQDRGLWKARNWALVGKHTSVPRVGTIVVWRNHVGIIVGRSEEGWIVKSGNDARQVRARVWSLDRAIALRELDTHRPVQVASLQTNDEYLRRAGGGWGNDP